METAASKWIASAASSGAELYERNLVPDLFRPFAEDLIGAAQLRSGERVLDVGCGTGIVARVAAEVIGESGRIVGSDVSEDFLKVAKACSDGVPIEWIQSDIQDLSVFPNASFDAVFCQQVLQFVPDRVRAVQEMARVLTPGGRALASVWTSLEEAPGYVALADAIETHVGLEPANGLRNMPFAFREPKSGLPALFYEAGFADVRLLRHEKVLSYPSVEDFVLRLIGTPPLAPVIAASGPDTPGKIIDEVAAALSCYGRPGRHLALPMAAYVVSARA